MRTFPILIGLLYSVAAQPASPDEVLTFEGYGLVTFGMTITDAVRVLGQPRIRINDEGDESCYYARFEAYPGVRFMVEDSRVVRAEPPDKSTNALGLKVGMRLANVREKFKGRKLQLQEYDDGVIVFCSHRPMGRRRSWQKFSGDELRTFEEDYSRRLNM